MSQNRKKGVCIWRHNKPRNEFNRRFFFFFFFSLRKKKETTTTNDVWYVTGDGGGGHFAAPPSKEIRGALPYLLLCIIMCTSLPHVLLAIGWQVKKIQTIPPAQNTLKFKHSRRQQLWRNFSLCVLFVCGLRSLNFLKKRGGNFFFLRLEFFDVIRSNHLWLTRPM